MSACATILTGSPLLVFLNNLGAYLRLLKILLKIQSTALESAGTPDLNQNQHFKQDSRLTRCP